MSSPATHSASIIQWTDRLLPPAVLDGSPEDRRSARVLLTGTFSAAAICTLFTGVHLISGDLARAAVSAGACLPVAGTIGVLWATGRVSTAVHYLLGLCTAVVAASSFVAHEGRPALVALVIVPVAAVLLSGSRAGAIWGVITIGLLLGYLTFYPFTEAEQKTLWLMTIVTASSGFAATLIERGREQARREAERARERAHADTRDRLRAEKALHEREVLFTAAFRQSSSLLILVSLETGRILEANESFARLTGWSVEEALGKRLRELDLWTNDADPVTLYRRTVEQGRASSFEIRLRARSGAFLWLLASAEILHQDGSACILAEAVDITERKQTDRAMERYREQLEERYARRGEQLAESLEQLRHRDRLAAVGTLAAGVAHQINNPIGAIVAAAELAEIMDDDPDREQIRTDALATARDEAKRCGRIVKNVLKFSRDEPTVKWVEDLSPIVLRATHLARLREPTLGGRLDVSPSRDPLEVWASPIDIEQVVLNLIHNASESKANGAHVRIETREHEGFAEIVVTDDGDGIDPDARPHIFEPFFTSRLAEGGSGLGLSVVHGIVGDHGGKLEVEDVPEGGTRVRVRLPMVQTTD